MTRLFTKEEVLYAPEIKRDLVLEEREFVEAHKDHG